MWAGTGVGESAKIAARAAATSAWTVAPISGVQAVVGVASGVALGRGANVGFVVGEDVHAMSSSVIALTSSDAAILI